MVGRIDAAFAAAELPGLHGVVVTRHGALVAERYFAGADMRWGQSLGTISFGPETRHDLRSVSKSIVGLLYGIALAAGKVPPPATPLLEVFSEYPDLAADPARRALTIAHALTMTMGTAWNESLPYTDPENSEIAMERAPDRFRYVLGRDITGPPGKVWSYSGGATALIGEIIARGTGLGLLDYARAALFAPLGITDAEWITGSNGREAAASGLRLRPRDLARIGQAVLDGGAGVIPPDWLAVSHRAQVRIDAEVDYGYQWYLYNGAGGGAPWIGAIGNGGQRLFIVPARALVVAITCGNYDRPEQRTVPTRVLLRGVYGLA
jgi:CubicO group peptidase (beta-lactamase class C family)